MTDIDPKAHEWATRRATTIMFDPHDDNEPAYGQLDIDEYLAYLALYDDQHGPNDDLRLEAICRDDREFAMDVMDLESLPTALVIDWERTADGILTGYHAVNLSDGRKAYFR